jgi:hypothetical protein
MQLLWTFTVSEYWPTGQRLQASSSGVAQLKVHNPLPTAGQPWPTPGNSRSTSAFKCDPALQQRIRERSVLEVVNRPIDFCQLVVHNNCLNASAPANTTHHPKRRKQWARKGGGQERMQKTNSRG